MACNDVVQHIVELFDATCISQFESMGCTVKRVDKPSSWGGFLTAHIAAVSEDLNLKLILNAPSPLLAQTMPSGEGYSVADPELQRDWLLELANRFVGRLKNKLVDHGCVLKMGIPGMLGSDEQRYKYAQNISQDKIVRCFEVAGDIASDVLECRLYIDVVNESLTILEHVEDDDQIQEGVLESL